MSPSTLMMISFVHPALAAAALAAGVIPILVHLINQRRYRRVEWAAMSFLLSARGRSRKRVWLEQWLLMLVRVGVLVLLGLAIARPFVSASPFLPERSTRMHRVLLVDDSLSMSARLGTEETRFSAARGYAEQLITSFPQADAVSIVTLSEPASAVVDHAAYDRRLVRDALASLTPSQRRVDTAGALEKTREILDASDAVAGNRAVYLISDIQRHTWVDTPSGRGEMSAITPTPAVMAARRVADALSDPANSFNIINVASGHAENVAVASLSLETTFVAVDLPVRLKAKVVNLGSLNVQDLTLQLSHNGQIIRREPVSAISPGSVATMTFSLQFSSAGTHILEAGILAQEADVLTDDDTRFLSVEVRESIPVLLIDGRPALMPLGGQTGFLATALAPGLAAPVGDWDLPEITRQRQTALVDPKTITVSELPGEVLSDYAVIALCNVPRLASERWQLLEQFVSQGGGLLLFGGDLLDKDNYNRFGYADGNGMLPVMFTGAVNPTEQGDRFSGFSLPEGVHPITAEFAEQPDSGLFTARVQRYLAGTVDPARSDVVLRYTDNAPALIASRFGTGRVVVVTTTANMDWTNLPAKGDYVSLMLNTVAHLSPRVGEHRNIAVGRKATEPLTPLQSSLPLRVSTDQGVEEGSVVPFNEGLAFQYGPVQRGGVFDVAIGSQVRAFACNVDTSESDLKPTDGRVLEAAIDRPFNLVSDMSVLRKRPAVQRTSELASAALCGVLALLIVEMWLAMRFGSHRAQERASIRPSRFTRAAGRD
ncbi:MAG: VWA domain-containing protein [Phycisphaerales bacterium]|nr:MAG: VWA domain-containing protein [Phycisphaerales bacterium]